MDFPESLVAAVQPAPTDTTPPSQAQPAAGLTAPSTDSPSSPPLSDAQISEPEPLTDAESGSPSTAAKSGSHTSATDAGAVVATTQQPPSDAPADTGAPLTAAVVPPIPTTAMVPAVRLPALASTEPLVGPSIALPERGIMSEDDDADDGHANGPFGSALDPFVDLQGQDQAADGRGLRTAVGDSVNINGRVLTAVDRDLSAIPLDELVALSMAGDIDLDHAFVEMERRKAEKEEREQARQREEQERQRRLADLVRMASWLKE